MVERLLKSKIFFGVLLGCVFVVFGGGDVPRTVLDWRHIATACINRTVSINLRSGPPCAICSELVASSDNQEFG
jgi:hypothetical protein